MKIHFITFANSDSDFSQERIIYEAKKMDIFDSITFYTEKDFDEEFLSRMADNIKNFKRGYGYWSWKPYIIKKELEKVSDGDVVVYADSGCMFIKKNRNTLKEWVSIAANSDSGILSPCYGPYIEHDWTRGDLYEYINSTYNKDGVDIFDKAVQCGCGISLYAKKEKCVDFVNQWYDVMTNHFHLCTDEPSAVPNHPNFRENRHDQSVFSMLSKIWGIETIESANGILDKKISPIIAARCKSDKKTWRKPIDVLFDHQIFDLQKFGGISRMYYDIHENLNKSDIVNNYTGSGIARGRYQEFSSSISVEKTENIYLKGECIEEKASNMNKSIQMLKDGNFDVFYPTFFDPYFLKYLRGKPFVMSVHDMIPEIYKDYFRRNDPQIVGKKKIVKLASAIEVPTETTKRDLIDILGVDEDKIHVVGRALSEDFGSKFYNKNILGYDYILYVGQRNAYKRFDWFVTHISDFLKKHEDIHLVCTGKEFSESEKKLLEEYGIAEKAHTMFVDDITMASLYRYAKFFVFPSEYEGFGLPVLEAYKMGCIALLNGNNECFKEITFGNGTFFGLTEKVSNLSEVAESVIAMSVEEKERVLATQRTILSNYTYDAYIGKLKKMFKDVCKEQNSDEGNLDIFICTHKDFEPKVKDKVYKVINCNDINNDTWNGIKGSFYSEIMTYFYVAENIKLKDYVGFAHYRKYWGFMDEIPDVEKLIEEHGIIVAKPLKMKFSVRKQYEIAHNIEDLYLISGILSEKYPDYVNVWNSFLNGQAMFPYNMFIMKREEFYDYIEFMQTMLDEYVRIIGGSVLNRLVLNRNRYIKGYYPNNSPEYQFRIGGYLAERLTNAYIIKNHNKVYLFKTILTEDKYKENSKETKETK